jgi:serine/threonine protein kinase
MQAAPEGFVLVPGPEHAGRATRVFSVMQAGRTLLCKRLTPRAAREEVTRDALVREAALLSRLCGRGTPGLVASGEDAHGPWLVMEPAAGAPLEARIGHVEPDWLERAARRAFEALARVHEAGVTHGDVSPANVVVADDAGSAVLVDLGLARALDEPAPPPGPFRGTLRYAAPEVARGAAPDARSDAFSLAASLLHVWSGEPPRDRPSEAAMLLAAGDEPLTAWANAAARGLGPAVAQVLVACCAFDPAARPARRLW